MVVFLNTVLRELGIQVVSELVVGYNTGEAQVLVVSGVDQD
jgi:hypothetical protein